MDTPPDGGAAAPYIFKSGTFLFADWRMPTSPQRGTGRPSRSVKRKGTVFKWARAGAEGDPCRVGYFLVWQWMGCVRVLHLRHSHGAHAHACACMDRVYTYTTTTNTTYTHAHSPYP